MRRRRICAFALVVWTALLTLPAVACAHAVLERTVPARGADLKRAPERVAFFFNEPVELEFGSIRVYDSDGDQVQSGAIERPADDGSGIATALPADLPDGTYTATYRVISADSHPVAGGFTFSVGAPGASGPSLADLLAEQSTGGSTSAAFVIDRWIGYAATALLVGGLTFLLLVAAPALAALATAANRSAAATAMARRLRVLMPTAAAVGLIASLLALPLQVGSAAGVPFTGAISPDALGEVLSTRFGTVQVLRAVAFAAMAVMLGIAFARRSGPRVLAAMSILPAAVLLAAPGLAGHASTQDPTWLLFPLDLLHVAAMAVWLGGIAALLIALPAATAELAPAARSDLLLAALRRFSPIALACVLALALSGTVQAVVEVGGFGALLDTGFGRAVTAKSVLLVALVALGYVNRNRLIPAIAARAGGASAPGAPGRRLRTNLRLEVAAIGAALLAAAMMVGYAPPSDLAAGPVSGSVTVGSDYLEYTVEPAAIGANQVHLYLFDADDGSQADVKDLSATASLQAADVGPIELDLSRAGPGHYVAPDAAFGIEGDWTVEIAVRTSRFDEEEVAIDVPID